MKLTIQYTGQLANLTGTHEESIEIGEGARLKPVMDRLVERHGPAYAGLVLDAEGQPRSSLLVVLDGKQAGGDKGAIALDGVDTVMLMTPIAGG